MSSRKAKHQIFMFRAECQLDVFRFLVRLREMGWYISQLIFTPNEQPEVIIRVQGKYSVATLNNLRDTAERLVDCHVIYETLNYAEDYNGERYFPPSAWAPTVEVKSVYLGGEKIARQSALDTEFKAVKS